MWGSSFVGWHPIHIRRSFFPSFRPPWSSSPPPWSRTYLFMLHIIYSFIDTTQDLTIYLLNTRFALYYSLIDTTQDLTIHSTPLHSTPLHSIPLHSTPLHSTPLHSTPLHSTPPRAFRRACGARCRRWAPVVAAGPPSLSAVAGAVARPSRRGCGAHCRRWSPLTLCKGRRSTQSLQKGLLRALSPLGPPRSLQWQAQSVPRASRRGCGARCRRAPCGSVRDCHCDLQSNCHCDFHSSIDSCRFGVAV